MYFLLLVIVLSDISTIKSESEVCHINGSPIKNKYSTKTPYQFIVNSLDIDFRALESECDNLQYWSIIRHGTRYPSKKAIRLINNDAEVLKDRIINSPDTKLCPKDIELLRDWSIEVDESQAKDLHREGVEELIYMGERLFSRFPELFHPHSDYDHQNYLFRSTNTQRTVETFKSLALGLFSRPIAKKVKLEEPITPHDPLIRFYKLCSKWITSVKKNDTAKHEYFKFAESQYVTQVRENISTLLGFDEVITHEELEAIYLTCNFDQAWKPRQASPWCALFSDDGLEVMEYLEDLEYYWVDGPGHSVSYQPACLLIRDVYNNFLNVTKGGREEKGIFYFTHSGTILKFLAFLQTHTDAEHLTSDNFPAMSDRKWRTSKIGPFAANISFLLQKCGELGHLVCLYVNEKLTAIPKCGDGCCPWETFVSIYMEHITSCDFEEFCRSDDGSRQSETAVPDDRF